MTPFVSVVIPTAGRPQLLPRAVQSALACTEPGATEVIVVPNAGDQSWKDSLSGYAGNLAVKILPISAANANAARNHGLRNATGKYVRFLDDDDYFYPDACRLQYEMLEHAGADICSGGADYLNDRGKISFQPMQPRTDDLVEAMLSPERCAQPIMHVFLRSALAGQWWRESLTVLQDIIWMFDVCRHSEKSWVRFQQPVGAWYWHRGQRTSASVAFDDKPRALALIIRETATALEREGRMTTARREAALRGLWHCTHLGFHFSPRYWSRFARELLRNYPDSRPEVSLFRLPGLRDVDPILLETLLIPKRWLNYLVRRAAYSLHLRDFP